MTVRRSGPEKLRKTGTRATYRRQKATWITFTSLFAAGLLNALLGPTLPYMRQAEHISYFLGSMHQVAYSLGGMTAGVFASRSHAPRRQTIIGGLICSAVAGLLFGYGRHLPATILAAFLVSAFGTAAVIRMWAVLSDLHSSHRAIAMTEGEIAVSLAGVLTPAIVGLCASTALGWRFSTVVAFMIVVSAAVLAGVCHPPDTVREPQHPSTGRGGSGKNTHRTLTTIWATVALEFTLTFWAASYLHDDVGIRRTEAVTLVSVLYAANLTGRLFASRTARRLPPGEVLWLCTAIALVGMPILLCASDAAVAVAGLVTTGIGIGGMFPLASTLHIEASGRPADQALGQTLAVAGIGQIAGPLAAGIIAEAADLRMGLLLLPGLAVLTAATTRPGR